MTRSPTTSPTIPMAFPEGSHPNGVRNATVPNATADIIADVQVVASGSQSPPSICSGYRIAEAARTRSASSPQLHEVTHDILPWQWKLGYAEDAATFPPSMRKTFEWQANQGAAELLFQGDLFTDIAGQYAINMAAVLELASSFGASTHAAFSLR